MLIFSNSKDWYSPHILMNYNIPGGFRVFARDNTFSLKQHKWICAFAGVSL